MHACRHINELYACQVSDGYLVKQASSSGSNFSRFWQLMDEKFGPKVTSIFRAETSAKRYTWDKQSISHMHLRFSFFRIWAITIMSRGKMKSRKSRISATLPSYNSTTEKGEFLGFFFQWIYRKYLLIQHSFRPIRESHFYTLISIGCLYKILWPFITLHSNNLLRWFSPQTFTCLNTMYGVNMGVIGCCTSEQ